VLALLLLQRWIYMTTFNIIITFKMALLRPAFSRRHHLHQT
jgi:hypothetical protein